MKAMMEKLGLKIVEMRAPGRMDGEDVLFTGKELGVRVTATYNYNYNEEPICFNLGFTKL